ncbi:hypothetical protein TNIN_190141 [Trichonephila inaurata madagascariensis]|uniref:Uncharacterized protein n=1 Tax=Trichonephila inaurata madagascariensis TaxID=2747483 RepID=A0A8X7BPF4_9ARAC|nr:hypothetical protein TNIN_190141 [Trichonephila inaurata madagascariensis]
MIERRLKLRTSLLSKKIAPGTDEIRTRDLLFTREDRRFNQAGQRRRKIYVMNLLDESTQKMIQKQGFCNFVEKISSIVANCT